MASHRPRFTPTERKVMDELFLSEVLVEKVPGVKDIVEGAQKMREINEEIQSVGEFQRSHGFLEDRSMQRICKFNSALWMAVEQLHEAGCNCGRQLMGTGGHKAWFLSWLEGPGTKFDLRGHVVV